MCGASIIFPETKERRSRRSEEGVERGHVTPVIVRVKCEGHRGALCVRNCGATTKSVWGVGGPGVLHTLNGLGATAACL